MISVMRWYNVHIKMRRDYPHEQGRLHQLSPPSATSGRGWYRQIYHSADTFVPAKVDKERYYYTSIYFLLDASSPSHFHRLKHDELWYYHAGDPITIYTFYPNGSSNQVVLDPHLEKGEQLQYRISAGVIFGSAVNAAGFSLVSCAVAPGIDYHDFEIFDQQQ